MPTWTEDPTTATDRYVWHLGHDASTTITLDNATIHSDIFSYPTASTTSELVIDSNSVTFSAGFEDQIRRIVRKAVKECLNEEGFIVGKLPDEGPDEQSFNDIYTSEKDEDE